MKMVPIVGGLERSNKDVEITVKGFRGFQLGSYYPCGYFEIDGHQFQVIMAFMHNARAEKNHIYCALEYLGNEKVIVTCKMSIVGGRTTFLGYTNGLSSVLTSTANRTPVIDKWIPEHRVTDGDCKEKAGFISILDQFGVDKCDLAITVCVTLYANQINPPPIVCPPQIHSLSQDMKSLLDSTTSDCTIVLQDETVIAVHKLILCARSEVFRTMLNSKLSEGLTHVIEIKDVLPGVVRAFVNFLYADECDANMMGGHAVKLFKLAHQYQVLGLLTMTEHRIVSNLTVSNALDCLELSILYEREYMKQNVIKFIARHLKEFRLSDGFYSKIKAICNTGEVLEAIMRSM